VVDVFLSPWCDLNHHFTHIEVFGERTGHLAREPVYLDIVRYSELVLANRKVVAYQGWHS
jgi:hypothetical protein